MAFPATPLLALKCSAVRAFHVKLPALGKLWRERDEVRVARCRHSFTWNRSPTALFERVDDQTAKQLRIEVRALGRHPLVVLTDHANVIDGGRHH